MNYHKTITADEVRSNLQRSIDKSTAKLNALKGVTINTTHKVLTNRAISGDGARIDDYLGINKALFISYAVKYSDGHTGYMSDDIIAYSYYDENGRELGSNSGLRISRVITPNELNHNVQKVVVSLESYIKELKFEYKRADTIVKKRNDLLAKIEDFNNSINSATEAKL